MRALLVHPKFPITYWGFQYCLDIAGKKASLPPLGLVTVAAHLPADWSLRLVDLNITELTDADLVFAGEVEGRDQELRAAIVRAATGQEPPGRLIPLSGAGRPALAQARVPRFDLLDLGAYASVSIQYSRGCPYHCEFCDVIEIFGRVPRLKSPDQVLAELDALRALGWQGTVFMVDDNFIGNAREVKKLLPRLAAWQGEPGHPMELYTEASVNLADDPALLRGMVAAGFTSVFLGIETPSTEALRAAGKTQNLRLDLAE